MILAREGCFLTLSTVGHQDKPPAAADTFTVWTYDAVGNQRSAGATTYAYDLANRLISASVGTTTETYTGNGARLRRYTYGLDLLAQTTSSKGPYWYHHDGLGSFTDITSTTGSPLAWTGYAPFGPIRASGATSQVPANPFRFTGAYLDSSTALYHLRGRQYDPVTGPVDQVRVRRRGPGAASASTR